MSNEQKLITDTTARMAIQGAIDVMEFVCGRGPFFGTSFNVPAFAEDYIYECTKLLAVSRESEP